MRFPALAELRPISWLTLSAALVSVVIHFIPGSRDLLIYDRGALAADAWWRAWTGHWVHFGWPHLLVDTGLLVAVGWVAERHYPAFFRLGLGLMPPFVSLCMFILEPEMIRYGGLSALNLGILLYIAFRGWRKDWTDWFWPAVILAYVGELLFEHFRGGQGGGAIRFDDPSIRVATGAHLASAAYALLALGVARLVRRPPSLAAASSERD